MCGVAELRNEEATYIATIYICIPYYSTEVS